MTTSTPVEIQWNGAPVRIDHDFINPGLTDRPIVCFLHEGLGSISMWRGFPQALCHAAGVRGLVYSRPGYGRSTPRPSHERWGVDFLHRQAGEVLPALLAALGIHEPLWLLGHSDGGSIALLHASMFPDNVEGLVLMAPHIFTEDVGIANIRRAREAYVDGDLKPKLGRHHDDADSAFWGWNDIWLDPAFRAWNIEQQITPITCPVLAIQGLDDEYGTLAQIRGVASTLPQTRLLELAACGHSPHRDQPDAVCEVVATFIHNNSRRQI